MKKNNFKNRLIVFISCFSLLFSLCSVNVNAADVEPPFNDLIVDDWPALTFDSSELNKSTVYALFDYYDTLYNYNMTNGMRLVAIFRNNNSHLSQYQQLYLYFVGGTVDSVYTAFGYQDNLGTSNKLRYVLYVKDAEGLNTDALQVVGQYLPSGNVGSSSAYSFSTSVSFDAVACAYRDGVNGNIVIPDRSNNSFNKDGDVPEIILQNQIKLNNYIAAISSGSVTVEGYDLDIGSIFTAMMTASMSIFNGFFGFTLFGINIAGALVAILVVAIIIFVVKWLLGGK